MKFKRFSAILSLLLAISLLLSSCFGPDTPEISIPESSEAFTDYNDGVPSFEIPSKIV